MLINNTHVNIYVSQHLECTVGYTGPRCITPCPFPSYGLFCKENCICHQTECDYIKGCPTGTCNIYIYNYTSSLCMRPCEGYLQYLLHKRKV